MSDLEPKPDIDIERAKKSRIIKASMFVLRISFQSALSMYVGKENMPAVVNGLSEDTILGHRLCKPEPYKNFLLYEQAHGANVLAYDFHRPELYPESRDTRWANPDRGEGGIAAFIPDGIEDAPDDVRTDITFSEKLSPDYILNFDKPGIEKLRELGILARRSHEQAYEVAEQEIWIDELRSRGIAKDMVHQVTPKGHSLIYLTRDGGDPTPKKEPQLELARLPGILAH